jgi:hypothetical protein
VLQTNAVLYANYRYDIVGDYATSSKYGRLELEQLIEQGKAPSYSDAELTEVFDCPYIRALRLFEAPVWQQTKILKPAIATSALRGKTSSGPRTASSEGPKLAGSAKPNAMVRSQASATKKSILVFERSASLAAQMRLE